MACDNCGEDHPTPEQPNAATIAWVDQFRSEFRDEARAIYSEALASVGETVYLDQEVRQVVIPPAEMTAAIRSGTPIPNPSSASSVLVVMDLVNAKPGDSGSFTIRDLRRSR